MSSGVHIQNGIPAPVRVCCALFLLCLISLPAFGRPQQKADASATNDRAAVHEVEDRIAAALGRNDADALEQLWAPDYTFVNPAGQLLTKAQRLAMLRSGELKVESYSRDEESIRIYGNSAVVSYRSTVRAQRAGQDISSMRRVTTVLIKTGSRWQVVAQQSTGIGPRQAN